MTQEDQAFEEWFSPFGLLEDKLDAKLKEFCQAAWKASRESLKQELLSDEMVGIIGDSIMDVINGKRPFVPSRDGLAKAALQAVVGKLCV